jgi:hypothetical protein
MIRIADLLTAFANSLEDHNNEAMLLAEYDDKCLEIVAKACVTAAEVLKKAAQEVDVIEPVEESKLTPDSLNDIAALASSFDKSDDPELQRTASVLDEILLTIAAPKNYIAEKKAEKEKELQVLKDKYLDVKNCHDEQIKKSEIEKAIDNSDMTKEYRVMEAPLSTRHCPDHNGVSISRVSENVYQCPLDKKTYDFANGYSLYDGTKVPAGDISLQTDIMNEVGESVFDTRESRIGK